MVRGTHSPKGVSVGAVPSLVLSYRWYDLAQFTQLHLIDNCLSFAQMDTPPSKPFRSLPECAMWKVLFPQSQRSSADNAALA
jgi:hypothetical protein